MKYLIATIAMAAALFSADAATYYVDYVAGSDGNNGTSKATAWKRAPGMKGFSGSYQHTSGDRFIFKGGVRWPVACFQMKIKAGGSSESNRDYYGADTSWFAGGSFSRPLFDFEHTLVGPGWTAAAGVLVEGCNYITFDNLEFANHRSPLQVNGVVTWGAAAVCLSGVNEFTLNNCVIRDWDMPTPIVYGSSGGGGIIRVNAGGNNKVIGSTFHQQNVSIRSGTSIWNINEVAHSEIRYTATAIMSAQVVRNNYIHHLQDPTDAGAHSNVMLCNGGLRAYNNVIHDISPVAQVIFVAPGYYGAGGHDWIYNNLVYNVAQPCIAIDTDGLNGQTSGSHVFNNTLVGAYGSGHCIRVGHRANGNFPLLEARNNHFITSSAPILMNNLPFGGGIVSAFLESGNIAHTPSQASALGYTLSNRYAPVDNSKPTVTTAGRDLSSIFTTDLLGNLRSPSWNIGAYQHGGTKAIPPSGATGDTGGSAPPPPTAPTTPTQPTTPTVPTTPTEPTTPTVPAPPTVPTVPTVPSDPNELFVNHSFEAGYDGWTFSGNQKVTSGLPYVASDETRLVAFNAGQSTPNGALSQTVDTVPGTTYTLAFDVGVLAFNLDEQRLQVTAQGDSTLLSQTMSLFGSGDGTSKWFPQSFTFVADSEATTLTFRDVSTISHALDLLLDHVRLSSVATPSTGSFSNGSFESDYQGWTQSGYQGIRSSEYYTGGDGGKLVVFNSGDMPPNGTLSQSFETTVGQKYVVTCDVGALSYPSDEQRLEVNVTGTGTLVSDTVSIYGPGGGRTSWTSRSFTFVADNALTTLTFRDVSRYTRAVDLMLDNVQVLPAD